MKKILCIDPGWSGSIVMKSEGVIYTENCPETMAGIHDLLGVLLECGSKDVKAYIEKVHSFPSQGVCSVWTFALNFAYWQMALYSYGIPVEEVEPKDWMEKLGGFPAKVPVKKEMDKKERSRINTLNKKNRKNYILDKMQKRYPDLEVALNNADALAILTVMEK